MNMKKAATYFLCFLLLQFSWAKPHMDVEKAPRIDTEDWQVSDAGLKKTAVSMIVFGSLFGLATLVLCIFIPGLDGNTVDSSGSSGGDSGGDSGGGSGGGIPGL